MLPDYNPEYSSETGFRTLYIFVHFVHFVHLNAINELACEKRKQNYLRYSLFPNESSVFFSQFTTTLFINQKTI